MVASKAFYQCTQCGTVHEVEQIKIEITDELYTSLWCPHCKKNSNQMWVGKDILDYYETYNLVLDHRMYDYSKKIK